MKALLFAAALAVAPVVATANDPVSSLQLDQLQHLTTTTGKIIPQAILMAQVGKPVRIHLPDGSEFQGIVIRREEALKEYVKVYGEVVGKQEQCGFGLFISAEGKLEGAFLFRDSKKTYTVVYDADAKGFIFKFKQAEGPVAIN